MKVRSWSWCAPIPLPFVCLVGAAFAQQWDVDGGPRWQHAATIDTVRNVLVVLGRHGDTHEWDGQVWRRRPVQGPRAEQVRLFEFAPGRIVAITAPFAILSETWQYDGIAWRNLLSSARPASRFDAALALDNQRSRVVMFGGTEFNGTALAETWEFDGGNWILRSPAVSPPQLSRAAMAFDRRRGRCVLFGGQRLDGTIADTTWEYDGSTWSQRAVAGPPAARVMHEMAFDPTRNRTVMLGGFGSTGPMLDIAEWDGATWVTATPSPALDQRVTHELVFDPARGEVLAVAGGPLGPDFGAILAWNGSRLRRLGDLPEQPSPRMGFTMAQAPNGGAALLFGGSVGEYPPVFGDLWRWDGRRWALLAASGPPPRLTHMMWSDLGATYVLGGTPAFQAPPTDDLWRWNGASWQPLAPAVRPAARWGAAVAFDLPRNRAVLFGGQGSNLFGDTWEFDGSAWTQLSPAQAPSPRIHHAMAGDPVAGRVVLFGGYDHIQGLTETWEWNGSAWAQVVASQQPGNPIGGSLAYDVRRSECIYAVQRQSQPNLEFWSYANGGWQLIPWAGALSAAFGVKVFATTGLAGTFVFDGGIVQHLAMNPPVVATYGAGCGAAAPVLAAQTLPRLLEPQFGFEVTRAGAALPTALIGGLQQVAVPLPGCTLLASPDAVAVTVADAGGTARYAVPVPALLSLLGVTLHWQAAGLQPASATGFALSAGLRTVIGD